MGGISAVLVGHLFLIEVASGAVILRPLWSIKSILEVLIATGTFPRQFAQTSTVPYLQQ